MRHAPQVNFGRIMRFVLHTIGAFAQAFKGRNARFAKAAAAIVAAATLAGCSLTGKGLDEASVGAIAIVDDSMLDARDPFKPTDDAEGAVRDRMLDEDTIRNAVTSADLKSRASEPLMWANQSTGSKGVISAMEQLKIAGQVCRRFDATRESYDGVTLYKGELCLDRRTGWWTRILAPAETGTGA